MAKNKVKSGLADIINGMKKDVNAGSAWHVKRIAQLEAMLAAESGMDPTAAPEATAVPSIAATATAAPSAVIPAANLAPPPTAISSTATSGPAATSPTASAASTAKHTAATAAILTSMSKEALAEIDRQKKLDTIKAKNKRDSDDKLLASYEKGQNAIQDALGGRKERKDLGTRIEDKKNSIKEFFTLRGFLDKTGIVKKDSGSLIDDMLGRREDKKNFENAHVKRARADHLKAGGTENDFDEAGIRTASSKRFDQQSKNKSEIAKKQAAYEKLKADSGLDDEALRNTGDLEDITRLANKTNRREKSKVVPLKSPKVKAPSTFEKTMKGVSESMSKVGNVFTKKPGNVAANMGTPGGSIGSTMSSAMKSIASKPGSIGKSVMSSLSSGVGKTALQGVGKAAMGMMSGPAMAGIAAAAGPALAAAAPFVLGAAAIGVAGYGAYKAYKALTAEPEGASKPGSDEYKEQVRSRHFDDKKNKMTSDALQGKVDRGEVLGEGEQKRLDESNAYLKNRRDNQTPAERKISAELNKISDNWEDSSAGAMKPVGATALPEGEQKRLDKSNSYLQNRRNRRNNPTPADRKTFAELNKIADNWEDSSAEAVKPTSASLIDSKSAENAAAATEGKTAPNNVVVAPVTNNSVQNHPTTYKQLSRNPDTTFTRHIDSRMSGAF
jgi:hypothetical protein